MEKLIVPLLLLKILNFTVMSEGFKKKFDSLLIIWFQEEI